MKRLRVLAMTKLFPSAAEPLLAPFNRQQFAALGRRCDLTVLATVPWFPGRKLVAATPPPEPPRRETIDGLDVAHPRTLYVPRMPGVGGFLYAASILRDVLARRGAIDVLFAAWAHPDGSAAILLGELLRLPVVVKVHGSDVNVLSEMSGAARNLRWLLPRATRVVAVSRPLAERLRDLGVHQEKIDLVYNGVDSSRFRVRDRAEARRSLGVAADRELALFVGNLKKAKGVVDLLEAWIQVAAARPRADLVIVGEGEDRPACEALVARLGGRARLLGARPPDEVGTWLAACDLLTLPSWAEGTPNVVLEALASGRRVVATIVGGIPDLVTSPEVGVLVTPRDVGALADALTGALGVPYDPNDVARASVAGDWDHSAERLLETLTRAASGG